MSRQESLSEAQVINRLKEYISKHHGTAAAFARSQNVSSAYVSQVINRKLKIPASWLFIIGVCALVVTTYKYVEDFDPNEPGVLDN